MTRCSAMAAVLILLHACASGDASDPQRERAQRRLQLAAVYFEQNQLEVALHETRAALQADPHSAAAHNLMGLIYQRQQQPSLAQQRFAQAARFAQSPGTPEAERAAIQHNFGWFLCEQGQSVEGQAQLAAALAQPGYTQKVKTWVVMGDCQLRAGHIAQAQRSWRQALELEPHNTWVQNRLATAPPAPQSKP